MRTWICLQAYKYIFTSPSSVEKEPKATRSGNAQIHGMMRVTMPSIAYVAMQVNHLPFIHTRVLIPIQVRFALSSSPVFSRTDTMTDSERFYNTVLDLFDDVEEWEEVNELQTWWNRYDLLTLFSLQLSHMYVDVITARYSPAILLLDVLFVSTALWQGSRRNGQK